MVRDKLKLNEYPKLLNRLNFGIQGNNNEKNRKNINIIGELIKSIYNWTTQISEDYIINHIYFWINDDYEWLLFLNDKFYEDPISFFNQITINIKSIEFNESGEYYKKRKIFNNIISIKEEIHGVLETITDYKKNYPKKKMKKLIEKLPGVDDKTKKQLKDWWDIRCEIFAHTEKYKEILWDYSIEYLIELKNKMEKYRIILNNLKERK